MSKRIQYDFTSGDQVLVSIPSDLGFYDSRSISKTTYRFVEYKEEGTRCILEDPETGETFLWNIGWVKPLKKVSKKVA